MPYDWGGPNLRECAGKFRADRVQCAPDQERAEAARGNLPKWHDVALQ